ncbi:hypothetical protein D1007_58894 [Hordeum vulgare]|nr:hypothetical protein D1007_58894 [Hordeum vulgare]
MMEEDLNDFSIPEEHRTVVSAVLKSIQYIDSRLTKAFGGLLTGIKGSSSAAAPNSVELAKMNRKLKSSEEELNHLKKRFDDSQAVVAEVDKCKAELSKARQEVGE